MKNRAIIRLFLCLALIQLAVPMSMIVKREAILKNGLQYKFKVAPVDPYDPFRGRYVALSIDKNYVPQEKDLGLKGGQTVFALIDVDAQGFAQLSGVTINRPVEKAYIQVKVGYVSSYDKRIYLNLPVNRYYMEEKAAPVAERIYQRHAQRERKDAYIVVRIKDGFAVIENLYVGGQKIEDAVKKGVPI
jgi:uncharacterized membrane-anchored protein